MRSSCNTRTLHDIKKQNHFMNQKRERKRFSPNSLCICICVCILRQTGCLSTKYSEKLRNGGGHGIHGVVCVCVRSACVLARFPHRAPQHSIYSYSHPQEAEVWHHPYQPLTLCVSERRGSAGRHERLWDGLQGEEEEGLRLFYIFYITKVFCISEDTEQSTCNAIRQTLKFVQSYWRVKSAKNLFGPHTVCADKRYRFNAL